MQEFENKINQRLRAVSREALELVQDDLEELKVFSFRKGKLSSPEYLEKLYSIYLNRLKMLLDSLLLEGCTLTREQNVSLIDTNELIERAIAKAIEQFQEALNKELAKNNTKAHPSKKLFSDIKESANDQFQELLNQLKNDLSKRVRNEKRNYRKQKLQALYSYLSAGLILFIIVFFAFILPYFATKQKPAKWGTTPSEPLKFHLKEAHKVMPSSIDEAEDFYEELLADLSADGKKRKLYAEVKTKQGQLYYEKLKRTKDLENLRLAVNAYQDALKVYVITDYPVAYANAQKDMGVVYLYLPEVQVKGGPGFYQSIKQMSLDQGQNVNLENYFKSTDPEKYLEKAKEAFLKALMVFDKNNYPMQYGMLHVNLGNVFYKLSFLNDGHKQEYLIKAKNHFEAARSVFEPYKYPVNYSLVMNGLAAVYFRMSSFGWQKETYQKAQNAIEEAFKYLPVEGEDKVRNFLYANQFEIEKQSAIQQLLQDEEMGWITKLQKIRMLQSEMQGSERSASSPIIIPTQDDEEYHLIEIPQLDL